MDKINSSKTFLALASCSVFTRKVLKQAQEQAQEKGKVYSSHLCLLHVLFLRQGSFHCEIRILALGFVSTLVSWKIKEILLRFVINFKLPDSVF